MQIRLRGKRTVHSRSKLIRQLHLFLRHLWLAAFLLYISTTLGHTLSSEFLFFDKKRNDRLSFLLLPQQTVLCVFYVRLCICRAATSGRLVSIFMGAPFFSFFPHISFCLLVSQACVKKVSCSLQQQQQQQQTWPS